MGTGSFGGGSGSFGGGGSGASLSGGGQSRTDSVLERIRALIDFTGRVNANPALDAARQRVREALGRSARSKYLRELIADPFVDTVFRELLEIDARMGQTLDCRELADRYGLAREGVSLLAVVSALINKHRTREVDERFVEIVHQAVKDIFLQAVNNDYHLYMEACGDATKARFDRAVLQRTCNRYLKSLMREVIRRDVLDLSTAAKASLDRAAGEVADRWVALFEGRFRRGDTRHRDMLAVMARDYQAFSGETR